MESRYALRELEGAIGYDCRCLPDGRRAIFRHTGLHRSLRREFFERRDLMAAMQSSFVAAAAAGAGRRAAFDIVEAKRRDMLQVMFPYIHFDAPAPVRTESIDDLFDELDSIIAAQQASQSEGPKEASDS